MLSGYKTTQTFQVNFAKKVGLDAVIDVMYEMYEISDTITIVYEGNVVYEAKDKTGDGVARLGLKGQSSVIDVTIGAPNPLSAWDFSVSCA